MDVTLGVSLYGTERAPKMVRLVELAEELGYRNVWLGDSQNLWREAYTVLGAAAPRTKRIILGTGVTHISTRHISVLASAFMTLHELAEGRVAVGIGTGDSALRTLGLTPPRRAKLEEGIASLRGLLAGDEIESPDNGFRYRLHYASRVAIPVYVAAGSRRTLELAGRIADGVILGVGPTPELINGAIGCVEAGATAAGRTLDEIDLVLWAPFAVADEAGLARDAVRACVAGLVQLQPPLRKLNQAERDTIASVQRAYQYENHMKLDAGHGSVVPDSVVETMAIAGTVDDCRDRVREICQTRINQIAVIPFGPSIEDRPWVMRTFAKDIARPVIAELRTT